MGQVKLIQRRYEPADGSESNRNDPDSYRLVLPYSRGRLRLERRGTVLYDGVVKPGMVRVVAPREKTTMVAGSRFESVTVKMPAAMFEGVAGGGAAGAVHAARREVGRLCPAFVSALGLRGRRRDLVVEGLTTALIGLMLGEPAAPRSQSGLTDAQGAAAIVYAEQRFRDGVQLNDWAAVLDMEVKVFSRRFSEHLGSSPYAWFMDRRITESMLLLSTSNMSIVDIALEMGFSSQSHFTDAFRRRTGVAPGTWRAQAGPDGARPPASTAGELPRRALDDAGKPAP